MRIRFSLLLVGLGLLNSGCTLVSDATHLVAYKTSESIRDHCELQRNRRWAEDAWEQQCRTVPHASQDYADGFVDGFAEFLYSGGNGDPPVLPPKKYRHLRYQSPEGYRAIEDWFAGYRHGAAVARERGIRELVTGPSSLRSAGPSVVGPPPGAVIFQTQNFQLIGDGHVPPDLKIKPAPTPEVLPPPPKVAPLGAPEVMAPTKVAPQVAVEVLPPPKVAPLAAPKVLAPPPKVAPQVAVEVLPPPKEVLPAQDVVLPAKGMVVPSYEPMRPSKGIPPAPTILLWPKGPSAAPQIPLVAPPVQLGEPTSSPAAPSASLSQPTVRPTAPGTPPAHLQRPTSPAVELGEPAALEPETGETWPGQ